MKAYQLKIQIKNSKPPIWRRVIVPAGLSFSQLSVLLNEVMGWCGYHLSSFEFYHLGIRIEELQDWDDDFGFGEYEQIEASETMIDAYLDSEDWFTYVYDFGDDWQHRVTVEKRLTDYDKNYAEVLKYKGETPYEDCGGIYGYYEILEILKEPQDPQYEEMKEWTEGHFTEKYDMQEVNEILEMQYLSEEKSEPMIQEEIYEELLDEGRPLKQIQGCWEIEKFGNVPTEDEMLDVCCELEKMIEDFTKNYKRDLEKKIKVTALKDIFAEYRKANLVEIAKIHHLSGYSKYTKEKLCEFLMNELLDVEVMSRYLEFANDEVLELLNKKECIVYIDFEDDTYDYLLDGGYAGFYRDGFETVIYIPKEVKEIYRKSFGAEWRENRKSTKKFLEYLNGAVRLYGVCPLEKALELYQRDTGKVKDYFEVYRFAEKIPENKKAFVLKDEELVLKELIKDNLYKELLTAQGNKLFYEPTISEIECLGANGYLPFDKYLNQLKNYFVKEDEEPKDAEELCIGIEYIIRTGGTMQSIIDYLEWEFIGFEEVFGDDRRMKMFMEKLHNVWNHTRMMINRGYKPVELSNMSLGKNRKDNIIAFPGELFKS